MVEIYAIICLQNVRRIIMQKKYFKFVMIAVAVFIVAIIGFN